MPLNETQVAALFVLEQTPFARGNDDLWRPKGLIGGPPEFHYNDVRTLHICGFAKMESDKTIITENGRAELERRHLI